MLPVDPKRCQALVPNGYNFMTLGGVPGLKRCTNEPTWIATEKVAQEDGRGSMSLCDSCKTVCERDLAGKVTFQVLGPEINARYP